MTAAATATIATPAEIITGKDHGTVLEIKIFVLLERAAQKI